MHIHLRCMGDLRGGVPEKEPTNNLLLFSPAASTDLKDHSGDFCKTSVMK